MNYEQFITLVKQMLNMYYEKNGQTEGEMQFDAIITNNIPNGRKGLFATNKSNIIFEVIVDLEEKKSYLNLYEANAEGSLTFDLTINEKEKK